MDPFWITQQSLTPIQWAVRAFVMYVWLLIVSRTMGQREIGRLTLFDFVVSVMMGTAASSPLSSSQNSLIGALIGVGTLGILDRILTFFSFRNPTFRHAVEGEPRVIIKNGELLEDVMKQSRFNMDDLLGELREKGVPNLADVEFAVLEPEGDLSVIPKSQARPLTPEDMNLDTPYEGLPTLLIEEGKILEENIKKTNLDQEWLHRQLDLHGINDVTTVLAAMIDTRGRLFVSRRDAEKEA